MKGKTVIITGASRGIGRAIALRVAREGANVGLLGKSFDPHPKLPGTLVSVAKEVEAAGGQALPVQVDVRFEDQVEAAVAKVAAHFGGVDALVNNAGAIQLTGTESTEMKRFDLMHQVNVRAVYLCTQKCLPWLKKSESAHVLNLSPPLTPDPKWLAPHLAYTLSKFGMSLCTLGMAEEFRSDRVAVNSLWPKRLVATAATRMLMGDEATDKMRKPEVMADAAYAILGADPETFTGLCLLDEEVLAGVDITNLEPYNMTPGVEAPLDLFIDGDLS